MKGIIYKLYYLDDFYIGSTATSLTERLSQHICDAKRKNTKLYEYMKKNGADKFKIELIEEVDCLDISELRMKESEYFDVLNPTLNEIRPYTTIDEKKEFLKDYVKENKDRINEIRRKNRSGPIFNEKQRKARELKKDIINEKKRKKYKETKDVMNEKRRKKYKEKKLKNK